MVKRKQISRKTKNYSFKKWLLYSIATFIGITFFWVIALRFVNPPTTYLIIQRSIERKSENKKWIIKREWIDYSEISDHLKRAAIAGEDANFISHHGFDSKAIKQALAKNKEGKKLRGGSTISQQVAKNVFLWPNRSWVRKGFETYFTVLIETFWSKKRILEVYLNMIEMGQGVFGAEAASHYYFNKSCSKLSKREAALIVAILPNPQRWGVKNPSSYINRRANSILRYMNYYNIP